MFDILTNINRLSYQARIHGLRSKGGRLKSEKLHVYSSYKRVCTRIVINNYITISLYFVCYLFLLLFILIHYYFFALRSKWRVWIRIGVFNRNYTFFPEQSHF